jgi:hypothetical protein
MPASSSEANQDPERGLPPAGRRWGAGAQSVLPYLTKSLQSRPASTPEPRGGQPREGQHPVFANWPPPAA